MKLFTKYNRVNLVATIIIFLLSSTAFYFAIRYILINQVDDDLRIEQREIETYVKEHNTLPESISVKDQNISYVLSDTYLQKRKFETIAGNKIDAKEKDLYRILQFGVIANGKIYLATVAKSLEGADDLTHSILLISSATILLILAASFLINSVLLKRLWKPFYNSLDVLKNFRVDKNQSLNFPTTQIDEFAFMDQIIQKTTNQAQQEYSLLKEFTENASHEMQTPLAIIRSKLDLLLQDENLSEGQSKTMQSAYSAIEKLSRLNQSLLLLAKIENNQFAETSLINLKQKLEEKLDAFHELWQNQSISVSSSLVDSNVNLNSELTDILLNNLLSNATRHNFSNGYINVVLKEKMIEISNSSREKELNSQQMFLRFFSQDKKSRYNGLGLSIIKQICDVSGFSIRYLFTGNEHRFILSW
ncbi:MAG TPA: HAMP domain-containing sensor histidine kinase [Chitinophagaceae bacterium]|jgi:signal transduction histidine kinase|nr:HAMP domain-containing sensor histidine kinase [Chitinophagaceae bacterium]